MSAATATDVAREVVLAVDKSRNCLDNRWITVASSPTTLCAKSPGFELLTRTPIVARTIFLTRACMRRWCRSATGPRCAGRGSNGRPDQGGAGGWEIAFRPALSRINPDGR